MRKKRKIILSVIIALIACTGGYLIHRSRPQIRRMRQDRRLVEECKLDASVATEAHPETEGPDFIRLSLGNGEAKCVGRDVIFYSRSMSHHNEYGKFRGYTYVKVNDRLFYNSTGPCTSSPSLRLPVHKISDVDLSIFVEALRKWGYREL